jgi:hypothetical protein
MLLPGGSGFSLKTAPHFVQVAVMLEDALGRDLNTGVVQCYRR